MAGGIITQAGGYKKRETEKLIVTKNMVVKIRQVGGVHCILAMTLHAGGDGEGKKPAQPDRKRQDLRWQHRPLLDVKKKDA